MKRLSILFVGLLSAVLIFSVVGLATEMDHALTTITFQDSLVIEVTDDGLADKTITQTDLEEALGAQGETQDQYIDLGDVEVSVWALEAYAVGATFYDSDEINKNEGLFEIKDSPSGGSAIMSAYGELQYHEDGEPSVGNKPGSSTVVDLTEVFDESSGATTADANWPSGTVKNFNVQMDLQDLSTVTGTSESSNFRINFWVYAGAIS